MPRTLPWLIDAAKAKEGKRVGAPSSPAPKRKRDSSDEEDLVDDDLNIVRPVTPERKSKRPANRTPSTSPPPAPPDVEYMREGYTADDIYLMVEDEFISTAKMYTQHIHHAEYVRLKKLARSRGAETLDAIRRPTDGRTKQSIALRMKLEAEEKDGKIKNRIKKLSNDHESSEAEDEYMYDPQLAGLMTREHLARRDISKLSKVKSNTRAAAGFVQSPHNVERKRDSISLDQDAFSEDGDDLDGASAVMSRQYAKVDSELDSSRLKKSKQKTYSEPSGTFKPFGNARTERQYDDLRTSPSKANGGRGPLPTENHDKVEQSMPTSSASTYLARKRAEKERKERDEKRKARKADEIPTFLF